MGYNLNNFALVFILSYSKQEYFLLYNKITPIKFLNNLKYYY